LFITALTIVPGDFAVGEPAPLSMFFLPPLPAFSETPTAPPTGLIRAATELLTLISSAGRGDKILR